MRADRGDWNERRWRALILACLVAVAGCGFEAEDSGDAIGGAAIGGAGDGGDGDVDAGAAGDSDAVVVGDGGSSSDGNDNPEARDGDSTDVTGGLLADYCGDGSCNGSEDCASCARDCGTCAPVCGDGQCNEAEDCRPCESDCGACDALAEEDTTAGCSVPTLPLVASLTTHTKHPDTFQMLSGSRISQKSEWACRRAEIKAQAYEYELGDKPPIDKSKVSGSYESGVLTVTVNENGVVRSFDVPITKPSTTSGPSPLMVALWTHAAAGEPGVFTVDDSVFMDNGIATTIWNNDLVGEHTSESDRGKGLFYDIYGSNHSASAMIAWAWGLSRIIDALEKTPEAGIDPTRIGVTGCSRWGKGALVAGALDDRVALTIAQESGAGGGASFRVSQYQHDYEGENVETLGDVAGIAPWFRADFDDNFAGDFDTVSKLPIDQHMIMSLVAPRALVMFDNNLEWFGIDASFNAAHIAHRAWDALDVPEAMAYRQTSGHDHCEWPDSSRPLLEAYVQKFLLGIDSGSTSEMSSVGGTADLEFWADWSTPDLR